MDNLISVGVWLYILLFFASVIFSLKFQFGNEGNDERGKNILNTSYGVAFPLILLGWLGISLSGDFLVSFSLESFQKAIWFLITGTYIVHAIFLFSLKRIS